MTTNGWTRTTASGDMDLSPSRSQSLSQLSRPSYFSSVIYRTEVSFYKRIPDAHRKRRKTPPISNVISKTSEIVFTSPIVLLIMTSKMYKLFSTPCKETSGKTWELNIYLSSPDVIVQDVENTYLGQRVFLCVGDGPLFRRCFCRHLFLRRESPNFL